MNASARYRASDTGKTLQTLEIDPHAKPSTPQYEVDLTENVMVTARDGVQLATDIYLPARNGQTTDAPLPVLIHRTPYNKSEVELGSGDAWWFAERGYAVVVQDCRGCFESGGDVNFLFPEAEDGFDTLGWIGRQPWSNGRVGTWGCSWASWTQTAMAALGPDNLAAMVPNMSGANAHESSVRQGGALELRFLAWAFWHSASNTQKKLKNRDFISPALNLGAPTFADWLTRMPIRRGQTQLALVPAYEKWALEILTRADYDEYWKHPSVNPRHHYDSFPDIPILFVGGWYDSYARASTENFRDLSAIKRGPVRLLMGPWTHGSTTTELNFSGDVEFGDDAALDDFRETHLRWFDRWLKGVDTGIEDDPPLRIFVMGGGSGRRMPSGRMMHGGAWRDEREWPLARACFTDYYLHEDGALDTTPPEETDSSTTYRFDPANPVPSIGGSVSSLMSVAPMPVGIADPSLDARDLRRHSNMLAGGFDQRERPDVYGCKPPYLPIASRPDVLVFQTEPLEEPLEVTGPIEIELWVATSAPDTDFTAKLVDVYPPSAWYPFGYCLNLTDSITRLRYRNGFEKPELVQPGEPVRVTITLYPTSNLFVRGHRIRLDVSSSNYPRFDVNPNTGESIGLDRRRAAANNTVFHDRARPSRVVLPLIPA